MGRVIGATANIFFSIVLGAVALAFVAVQFPGIMESLLGGASWLRDQLTGTGLDPKYNVWVIFLIAENQLVFMGFIIAMRIILAFIMGAIGGIFGSRY